MLQNVKLLEGPTSDETKTSEGLVISYFGKSWGHMKTGNCALHGDGPLAFSQSLILL